jgi:glutaredoxin 3
MREDPILYIKSGCPWCSEALQFFSTHGVSVDVRDVSESRADLSRMLEVSGQTLTPTIEYGDFIVADFSVDELLAELDERPDIRNALGITDADHTG